MTSCKTLSLLDRFRGSMIGAVIGDCLGAPVECQFWGGITHKTVDDHFKRYKTEAADSSRDKDEYYIYTDDTAMARQVADSVISMRSVDSKDLASRFVREYFKQPRRGYGQAVVSVFKKLKETSCEEPFGPASEQFEGSGSYGNGAAMRVHPVGLWCHEKSDEVIFEEVSKSAKVTHTHADAVNGAILQAAAVSWALQGLSPHDIWKRAYSLCQKFDKPADEEVLTFAKQMKFVDHAIDERVSDHKKLIEDIGNDVSAIRSVPTAVYSFLVCAHDAYYTGDDGKTKATATAGTIDPERTGNPFEKTLQMAMSFGGDTDTICSMAGAMAGAYYGETGIPNYMKEICEGIENARRQADQLHKLVTQ